MKHPEHQCRHRDNWRDPAEDYPNTGRGGDSLELVYFSLLGRVEPSGLNYLFGSENNGEHKH